MSRFSHLSRRQFLRVLGGSVPAATVGAMAGLPALVSGCERSVVASPSPAEDRHPLRLAPEIEPQNLTLTAAPGTADVGGGVEAPVWKLNESLPSPLLRVRQGDRFRVTMRNDLPQDLILHWHGLAPPDDMDGHPRFAVPPGGSYAYDFSVEDRPGTYWYHSHTHMHTGEQTYRGIGGLLLVDGDEEEGLGLPGGEREIPIILQDRRLGGDGTPVYTPFGPDRMAGYMGPEPFGNGIRRPYLEVDSGLYRLRVLNGSNARIFRLARSDGRPLILIGNDGGLLEEAQTVASVEMGPAERVDILLNLDGAEPGEVVMIRSVSFSLQGGMGFMGGANLQGQPLDLLELRVRERAPESPSLPTRLSTVGGPDPGQAVRERSFRFDSRMMNHFINGRSFQMDRVDVEVPFGDTELWHFVNASGLPHPVHLHATHFRVVSRRGGRNRVMAWEEGLKDTVLLLPFETVTVAVRFTAHRGLYLLHCHNLEHEDMGMMANVLVV